MALGEASRGTRCTCCLSHVRIRNDFVNLQLLFKRQKTDDYNNIISDDQKFSVIGLCADFISYDLINVLFVKYYKYEGYAVAYRDCGISTV